MIVVGGGSHFTDIRVIAQRNSITNITVYDDDPETGWAPVPLVMTGPLIIGVNNPKTRQAIAETHPLTRGAAPLIDPSALIGPDVHFGHGCVIAPMVTLLTHVTLGEHVHINYHASATRCTIGDFTTVSPGAVICGDIVIGKACLVGAGATICDRVTIGNDVVVAFAYPKKVPLFGHLSLYFDFAGSSK